MSALLDSHFWAMGGYAAFVWPAYGISALGLAGAVVLTLKGWRDARRRLAALERDARSARTKEDKS